MKKQAIGFTRTIVRRCSPGRGPLPYSIYRRQQLTLVSHSLVYSSVCKTDFRREWKMSISKNCIYSIGALTAALLSAPAFAATNFVRTDLIADQAGSAAQ